MVVFGLVGELESFALCGEAVLCADFGVGVENKDGYTVAIDVTSDRGTAFDGGVKWSVIGLGGERYESGEIGVKVDPRSSKGVGTLDLREVAEKHDSRNLIV